MSAIAARTTGRPPAAARARATDDETRSLPGRPLLAVVDDMNEGDGVAHVGRLLRRALDDIYSSGVDVAALGARSSAATRARFFGEVAWKQGARRAPWVFFNHLRLARVQLSIPRRLRRPYAVFLHGVEAWHPELPAERRAPVAAAALRIANSHHTARRVSTLFPGLGPVIACPLALLPDAATAAAHGAPPADLALLSRIGPHAVAIVGRMRARQRYKGHDELLEAWTRVLARVPDAQLVIVGRGDDAARLRAKSTALGLDPHVLFAGFVAEPTLRALMQRCAAFAMPSKGEGFGLAYLDAMRASLPCIGSTADAASDVIVHDETGMLVHPDNRDELSDAVATLLERPDVARRMGDAGRRRLDERFTYERFRDRLRDVLADAAPALGGARA